jgi:alkylation response protein AidB-like acyl-CoA dehydrogenase
MALTQLSEDELMFRDTVRRFSAEQIAPIVRSMDESQHMDPELISKMASLGLLSIEIPEQYGGSAGTFFEAILAVEAISSVDPSVGVLVDVQNTLCVNALVRWATEAQKQQYLTRLATGTIGAYALSEASSGSDAFALQTRATKHGEDYVLNGQKLWITNAKEAGLFIVFATLDPTLGYKASLHSSSTKTPPDSPSAKKKTNSASAPAAPASSSSATASSPPPTSSANPAKATR